MYKGEKMSLWYKFLDKIIGGYINEEISEFYMQIQKAEEMVKLKESDKVKNKNLNNKQHKKKKEKK